MGGVVVTVTTSPRARTTADSSSQNEMLSRKSRLTVSVRLITGVVPTKGTGARPTSHPPGMPV